MKNENKRKKNEYISQKRIEIKNPGEPGLFCVDAAD